jgi:DNA-binding NarL/FixJ family response regulator
VQVILVEDSALLADGIGRLFQAYGHHVAATADTAERVLDLVSRHQPDVAVLDIRLPPTYTDEGIRAALQLRQAYPYLGILVLSQHVETVHAGELLADSASGYVGYLLKDRVGEAASVVEAAASVAAGGTVIDPEVISALLRRRANIARTSMLSEREHEVLALVAQGHTNAAIARSLHIQEATVIKHVSNIMTKLDLPPSNEQHRRVIAVLIALGLAP